MVNLILFEANIIPRKQGRAQKVPLVEDILDYNLSIFPNTVMLKQGNMAKHMHF